VVRSTLEFSRGFKRFSEARRVYKKGQPTLRRYDIGCDADSTIKLTLTDRSVTIQRESSSALGQGCRLGFLGSLHMSVFCQRLEDEYDANVIVTAPTVPYKGARMESSAAHSET
jgi:translation elongation factor EF-4